MKPPRLYARRAAAVTIAGLGLMLISLLFDAAPLFVPAIALVLLGLTAPAWVWASALGAHTERTLETERAVEDRPLAATIEVRRGRIGLPGAEVIDPFTGSRLEVGGPLSPFQGGRTARVRVVTRFPRRGLQVLAAPSLRVRDPLELASVERINAAAPQQLLVVPRTEPVRWMAFGRGRFDVSDGSSPAEALAAVDVDGLRPYRPGTPASRIHWPALARGAGLLERRLRADGESRPLVVLDAREWGPPPLLDAAVRAAASLALELARTGGCGLLLPGEQRVSRIDRELGGWPAAHARLALVQGRGPRAGAPALGSRGGRRGPILYVATGVPKRLPALISAPGVGPVVLVVPTPSLIGGRPAGIRGPMRPTLEVSGCRGFLLGAQREPDRSGRAQAARKKVGLA